MTTIKIAALDDNPTHLQMVEQALIGDESNWSLPVEFKLFSSGEMLLQELKKVDYDCVILDRIVPDMSGDVILNWLHQYRPNRTGVVMLTSNDARQEVVASLEAGADEYLIKPFFPAELLVRVKRLVERVKLQQKTQKNMPHQIASAPLDFANNIHHLHEAVFNDFELTVEHCEQQVKLTEREYCNPPHFTHHLKVEDKRPQSAVLAGHRQWLSEVEHYCKSKATQSPSFERVQPIQINANQAIRVLQFD